MEIKEFSKEENIPFLLSFYNDICGMIDINNKAIAKVDSRLENLNYGDEWRKNENEWKESCMKSLNQDLFLKKVLEEQVKRDYEMEIEEFIEKYTVKRPLSELDNMTLREMDNLTLGELDNKR